MRHVRSGGRQSALISLLAAASLIVAVPGAAVGAAPDVYDRGQLTVARNDSFDIDHGGLQTYPQGDLMFGNLFNPDCCAVLYAVNALQKKIGASRPGYARCRDADVGERHYGIERLPAGTWLCALTDQGRVSRLKIISRNQNHLTLKFTTWE